MINKQELHTYAKQLGLNLGQAEKNYLHIKTLHAIARLLPDKLVFKGGTSLMICHSLPRFSEDLDFTATEKIDIQKILTQISEFLKQQNITFETQHIDTTPISESLLIRYQGPLYDGTRQTTSKVELDISTRETIEQKPETTRILHPYKDTPTFYLQTMTTEEILAEKIRAILTRNKARDIYDAEYLIALNTPINKELINKKLSYYKKTFSKKELEQALENKKELWNAELSNLVPIMPEFDTVKTTILKALPD